MPDSKRHLVFAAAYGNVTQALAGLNAIEQLHENELIGSHDAATRSPAPPLSPSASSTRPPTS